MVYLKGKGAMTGVNLVAKVYENGATKDGKSQYMEVQVDARDSRAKGQTNLNLRSERVQGPNGEQRYNNSAPYSKGQMEEIRKVAQVTELTDRDGERLGETLAWKGGLMPASDGKGLVANSKKVEKSDFELNENTLSNQFSAMREARESRAASQTEQSAQAEQQTEQTAQVEQEEPAVG